MADVNYGLLNEKLSAPVEEAYRTLRTNIQFCGIDKKIKTLVITSCNPCEGKTMTAINLAVSMAKAGVKTLLIDTDLRKPMIGEYLGSANTLGLSNLISGYARLDDVINITGIANLYFIASGIKPPNPAELIGSAAFGEFLGIIREQFDIIIFDSPPLGSVIDCALISTQVDGTVIVIESNAVDYRNAQRVKEQLEKANARVLGVVLNKVNKSDFKNYYTYYYNYYGSMEKTQKGRLEKLKIFKKNGKALT